MSDNACDEMRLLVQADMDGELAPAESARVASHLEGCAGCAETQARLLALSTRLRREVPYHAASEKLRAAVRSQIAAVGAPAETRRSHVPWRRRLPSLLAIRGLPFGAGVAVAAGLAFALLLPNAGGGLPDAVVAGHIRALQPGHLMDVASTDQHTVKPWFDGRLDYAPPVKDFKAEGFPLAGGRLDYLAGRPVAALVYRRRQHVIELFAWPDGGKRDLAPVDGSRHGYNFLRWSRDGMIFWAVSDVSAPELAEFVRLWEAG